MLVSSVQGAEAAQAIAKTSAVAQTVQSFAPTQAFYFSPALVIDPKFGTDVLEYRNTSTGKVTNQYPSEKDIAAYTQNSLKPVEPEAVAKQAIITVPTPQKAVAPAVTNVEKSAQTDSVAVQA